MIGGSLSIAERYIGENPRLSDELSQPGWREAPVLVVLLFAAALCAVQPTNRRARLHGLLGIALVAWLGGVASSALTVHGDASFFWGALTPYAMAAIVYLAIRLLQPTLDEISGVVACAAVVAAGTVILDAAGAWSDADPLAALRRPHGLFYNRNYAGEYIALSLPFFVPSLSRRHARWLLVPLALALVWTRCRTAWITAAASGVALLFLWSRQSDRRALRVGLALFAFAALAGTVIPTRLHWREQNPYLATADRLFEVRSGSGALRIRQYVETFNLVAGRMLVGLGPGRWREEIARKDVALAINRNAHSDYLRALADGGLPSACGLLALWIVAALAARRVDPRATIFVVAFASTSLADCPLYRPETATLAAAVLAAIASALALAPAPLHPRQQNASLHVLRDHTCQPDQATHRT